MNTQTISSNKFSTTLSDSGLNVKAHKTENTIRQAFGTFNQFFADKVHTGSLDFESFKMLRKLINSMLIDEDTGELPGKWETVKHNGEVVFCFFVPNGNVAPTVEPTPTNEELFAHYEKITPKWITESLLNFPEPSKVIAHLALAAWAQKKVAKVEDRYLFCWVKGNVISGTTFVEQTEVLAGLPLFVTNSNVNRETIEASFELLKKDLPKVSENEQVVEETYQTTVTVAPTVEQITVAFDMLGKTSFSIESVTERNNPDNTKDYSIKFNENGRNLTKLWSTIKKDVANLSA